MHRLRKNETNPNDEHEKSGDIHPSQMDIFVFLCVESRHTLSKNTQGNSASIPSPTQAENLDKLALFRQNKSSFMKR